MLLAVRQSLGIRHGQGPRRMVAWFSDVNESHQDGSPILEYPIEEEGQRDFAAVDKGF